MRLSLIRHARTDANHAGRLSCSPDEPLNETGRQQAEALGVYLASIEPFTLWSSPLLRALQTLEPYLRGHDAALHVDGDLAEGVLNLDAGTTTEKTVYRTYNLPESSKYATNELPNAVPIPDDDESAGSFVSRVRKFIGKIRNETAINNLVTITHGHFIREFLNQFMGPRRFFRFPVKNCSETRIELGDVDIIHHVNREVIQVDMHSPQA